MKSLSSEIQEQSESLYFLFLRDVEYVVSTEGWLAKMSETLRRSTGDVF